MKKDGKILVVLFLVAVFAIGVLIYESIDRTPKYKVTFKDEKTVYNVIDDVTESDQLDPLSPPLKKGYSFEGWYSDGELFDFSKPITKDVVLEAKWSKLTTDNTNIEKSSDSKKTKENNEDTKKEETKKKETKKEETKQESKKSDSTSSSKREYTINVKNGTGTGRYYEGTVITISAQVPETVVSDWQGNTVETLGNVRYKNKITYSFKRWSDGSTNPTRQITVTSDATYTAEFNSETTQVDRQRYTNEGSVIYSYPSAVNFYISRDLVPFAAGQISDGCFSAIVKGSNGDVGNGSCAAVAIGSGAPTSYSDSFKWNNIRWYVSYDRSTGIISLTTNKEQSSSATYVFEADYSANETVYTVEAPRSRMRKYSAQAATFDVVQHASLSTDPIIITSHADVKTKKPLNITIQLEKVVVGRNNVWSNI